MCGIAGLVSFARPLEDSAPLVMGRMLERLHHRGPDDRGQYFSPHIALGNTRLSIVGIADGHQPIANEDGTVVTVMNGEIYNAPELRADLERKGHRFHTSTDTEVLVHLYEEQGADLTTVLEGMFAFAVYDSRAGKVVVGRDRFGMKPLFYFESRGALVFASELKALAVVPGFPSKLSAEGLATYLGLMYIPDPWTAYAGVSKLRPGHCLEFTRAGLRDVAYFDLRFRPDDQLTRTDAEQRLTELIPAAVKRHLMADVPIATLLSGGLDSRTVTAAMWQVGYPSVAFTIGYEESRFDEGGLAASWIGKIGGKHERIVLDEKTFTHQLSRRYRDLDEPYAVWVNGASAILAEHIRAAGFKVVLTGEGGDEFFCGYPTLHAANIARYYRKLPGSLRTAMKGIVNLLPAGQGRLPLAFVAQSFVNADHPDIFRTFFGFKEVLAFADWPDMLTAEAIDLVGDVDPAIAFDQYRETIRDWPLIDALSYLDIKVFLAGCSLLPNDNAFMSRSVETRIPLLDYRLIDFVLSLPVSYRFNPVQPKALLKRAMQRFLSEYFPDAAPEVRHYKKMGFEIPITDWIGGSHLGRFIAETLDETKIAANGFFRIDYVKRLLEEQRAGRRNNERKLQAILALEKFLDRA